MIAPLLALPRQPFMAYSWTGRREDLAAAQRLTEGVGLAVRRDGLHRAAGDLWDLWVRLADVEVRVRPGDWLVHEPMKNDGRWIPYAIVPSEAEFLRLYEPLSYQETD